MLPNMFHITSYKKHHPMLLDEQLVQEYSTLFFYLPSTTDREEKINQFVKNVDKILRNTLEIRQILDLRTSIHQI